MFTGKCNIHNRALEVAYNPSLDLFFWNCFSCFPDFQRAKEEDAEKFEEQFFELKRN